MKKYFLILVTAFACFTASAQSRGIRIAYIDMEYILDKVPDYAEAKNQLEQKAQKWKQEIESKKNDINILREGLQAEKALLTKELIEEREEEIAFLEKDLLDYQEKRFGPTGDLITQKSVLVKPIQDQVFTIIQDLSEVKKYDFVFDKSSDLTMLFAAQRHDISDLVIRRLTRAAKREQLSNKELKQLEELEQKEELESDPEYQDRQKKAEDRKTERERLLEERKATRDAKRQAFEERREQQKQEREARRNGTSGTNGTTISGTTTSGTTTSGTTTSGTTTNDTGSGTTGTTSANRPAATTTTNTGTVDDPVQGENGKQVKTTATDVPEEGTAESVDRQQAAQTARDERAQQLEDRRRAIEERKKKILEQREAAKKAREEQKNKNTSTEGSGQETTPAPATNQAEEGQD